MLGRMEMTDLLWQDIVNLKLETKVLGAAVSVEGKGKSFVLEGLDKATARKLYTIAQELEEQWREKSRIRRMEEERARAGGVYLGPSPVSRRASPAARRQAPSRSGSRS